jgi:hypothetical protein
MILQSLKLPNLSRLEFRKKVIEGFAGNFRNSMVRNERKTKCNRRGIPSECQLRLIQAHDEKLTRGLEISPAEK